MKKLYSVCTTLALVAMVFSPAMAGANGITTGLTQDTTGGATPIVKAKWEANGDSSNPLDYYTDDSTAAGAQFNPSGIKDENKTIALCSIVTDPDGLSDITNAPGAVYGDVFYPTGVSLGSSHEELPTQSGLGCGGLMQEDQLSKLSKADGLQLFCNNVRSNNNNLPTFNTGYDYNEICATDGELQKETAAVYCTTKDISYEDPSGDYAVWAVAQDKVGLQGKLINSFTYLPLTAFETDFTSILYGAVRLATHKIISGDLTWGSPLATVRNIGNTRLQMNVMQDDMGFGQTGGVYNVKYDARVGSAAAFADYWPNALTALQDTLDLSEMDEMDFSINVTKFPPTHVGSYTGNMTLGAVPAPHLTDCPTVRPTVGADLTAYVAPTSCDITVDDSFSVDTPTTFNNIQEGINAAITGNTVCVAAGTYTENVNVNKDITLAGVGASLVTLNNSGSAGSGTMSITASGATVEGLTINNTDGLAAVYISGARNGILLAYNSISKTGPGTWGNSVLLTDGGQTNHTISNNVFGGSSAQFVYVNGNVSVATPSTNVDFTSNTFNGTATGALLGTEANGSSITLNKFSGTSSYTSIESWEGNNLVNQNNFNVDAGVGPMHVVNGVLGATQFPGTLNAENNWWGDITPADNITGLVDFTPFEASAFPQN